MDESSNESWMTALERTVARWEVLLPKEEMDYFRFYLDELTHCNLKCSLTVLQEPKHTALSHFADSMAPMIIDEVFEAKNAHTIDVGTGAGFPGLPLKIANPEWRMSLVESIGKKCDFLRAAVGSMELNH